MTSQVAYAKGWVCHLKSIDREAWKYASLYLERSPSLGYSSDSVTGLCDITVDSRVRLQIHKTSFHDYGLDDLRSAVRDHVLALPWLKNATPTHEAQPAVTITSSERLDRLLQRFHVIARQLKHRHQDRSTLTIADEHDVQDLLHALLRLEFEDIRPEEVTPSYAGASSRLDFLLKPEKIVVEVKYATKRLRDKQIGEQLIVDILRYQTHPSCERLVCFVYDPESNIRNPAGLENDLSGHQGGIEVTVLVSPK